MVRKCLPFQVHSHALECQEGGEGFRLNLIDNATGYWGCSLHDDIGHGVMLFRSHH